MRRVLVWVCGALAAQPALADELDLSPAAIQQDFRALSADLTAALAYKALGPAEATGITGIGVGVVGSYTETEHRDAWRRATGEEVEALGLVGLQVTKGLPFNLDVGAFYTAVPNIEVELWGGELRYAFLPGSTALPALALRGSYTRLVGIDDFDFSTRVLDLSISKGFTVLTPYVGAGRVWGKSDPSDDFALLADEEIEEDKLFGGVRFGLTLFELTAEAERIGDNTSYLLRVGFSI